MVSRLKKGLLRGTETQQGTPSFTAAELEQEEIIKLRLLEVETVSHAIKKFPKVVKHYQANALGKKN